MSRLKCSLCDVRKPKRICPLEDAAMICSLCCLEKRGLDCGQCRYYLEAENYAIERFKSTGKHPFKLDMRYLRELRAILELVDQDRLAECSKRLQELAPLIPDSHLFHYACGLVAAEKKDYETALFHYNRSIEIFPYFIHGWFDKGIVFERTSEIGAMLQAWNMVKRLTKPEHELHQLVNKNLAEVEVETLKRNKQTLAEISECEKIYKTALDDMFAGKLDSALLGFEKILHSNPKHVSSYSNAGLCHALAGRREKAVAALKQALAIDPEDQPSRQNLQVIQALKPGEPLSRSQLADPVDLYKDRSISAQN